MKTLFTFIIKLEAWSTIDVDGKWIIALKRWNRGIAHHAL